MTRRGGACGDLHLEAVSRSFGRSPKLRTYLARRMPELSLRSRMSHLLRNSTRSTLASSLFEQTAFHSRTLSSCASHCAVSNDDQLE
jgi:hypothetical protein